MVGASSLFTLMAGMSIISPDVRVAITSAIPGDAAQLSAMASRAFGFVHTLVGVAGDYVPDSTPILGFGIVALVLTVMMTKT